MKRLSSICVALSAFPLVLSATPASQPLGAGPVATGAATTVPSVTLDDRAKFRSRFEAARKIRNTKEMRLLFVKNTDEAAIWIVELAHEHALRPKDESEALYADLESTWKSAKRSNFGQEIRLFFSGMEREDFETFAELQRDFNKLSRKYFALKPQEGKADPAEIKAIGDLWEIEAKRHKEFKSYYYESQCWAFVGACNDEYLAKDLKDLDRACDAYAECIDSRERIELKDAHHKSTVLRHRDLVAAGFGYDGRKAKENEPKEDEGGEAGGDDLGGTSDMTRAALTFELLPKIDAFDRPNYFADEHYPVWHGIYIREVGSEIQSVLRFGELWKATGTKVAMRRDSSAKIFIDVDGDQTRTEADVDVPVRGKLEPVHIKLDVGGQAREMAFYVQGGQESDNYQGIEANFSSSDTLFPLFASPAGTLIGEIDGTKIRIIDEDMNGNYGGEPVLYGHIGMTKGRFHPEFDSIVVGSSKSAQPFSKQMKIGKQWYSIEPGTDGMSIDYAPIEPELGTFKLKFSGGKPSFLVLQGMGSLKGVLIDLTQSSSVEAPVGEYQLLAGMLAKGKKKQKMKTLIIAGDETPTWTLEAGKTLQVAMGGPFDFDFKSDLDPNGCQVFGATICVLGSAGERYERPYLCVPRPSASARKPGAKKGGKPERMDAVTDTQAPREEKWFPKDIALDVKKVEDGLEVQLTEKKHRLFGKISSRWRTVGE